MSYTPVSSSPGHLEYIAAAHLEADGTETRVDNCTSSHPGAGSYHVVIPSPMDMADVFFTLTPSNPAHIDGLSPNVVLNIDGVTAEVSFDVLGVATDSGFHLAIWRFWPAMAD